MSITSKYAPNNSNTASKHTISSLITFPSSLQNNNATLSHHLGTTCGLSLWELQQFRSVICQNNDHLSLREVYQQYILPFTTASKQSYVDTISDSTEHSNLRHYSSSKRSQLPGILISCTWNISLKEVLEALETFFQEHASLSEGVLLWLDLFSMNYQFDAILQAGDEASREYLASSWSSFLETITIEIGHSLLIVSASNLDYTEETRSTAAVLRFSTLSLYQFYISHLGSFFCPVLIPRGSRPSSSVATDALCKSLQEVVNTMYPVEGVSNIFESELCHRGPPRYETYLLSPIVTCTASRHRYYVELRDSLLKSLQHKQQDEYFIFQFKQSLHWIVLHPHIHHAVKLAERLALEASTNEIEFILLRLLEKVKHLHARDAEYAMQVCSCLNKLAELFQFHGKIIMAELMYVSLVDFQVQHHGVEHAAAIVARQKLAFFYYSQALHIKAQPIVQQNYECAQRTLGASHPTTFQALSMLANIDASLNNYAEALVKATHCVELARQHYDRNHPAVQIYEGHLQSIRSTQEMSAEARTTTNANQRNRNMNIIDEDKSSSGYDLESNPVIPIDEEVAESRRTRRSSRGGRCVIS